MANLPILDKTRMFLEKTRHILVFIESWLHAKSPKKVTSNPEEITLETDRWIELKQFLGPSRGAWDPIVKFDPPSKNETFTIVHLIDRLSGHAKRAPENIKVLLKKRKQKKQTGP